MNFQLDKAINVYKPIAMTPLQCLNLVREYHNLDDLEKITYVGRLDPMAHGVLLLLRQPTPNDINQLKGLDKVYRAQFLLGIESDTYDLLGFAACRKDSLTQSSDKIVSTLKSFVGCIDQKYPPYSSIRVHGKPLFYWAKTNQLATVRQPSHMVNIFSLQVLKQTTISNTALFQKINHYIPKVKGDFRQKQICENWYKILKNHPTKKHQLVSLKIHCSSGTYIRQIAHDLGNKLGCGSLAYDIKRTQVGPYVLNNSITV